MRPASAGDPALGVKRHFRAEVVPGDAVYLFSQRGITELRGPYVEELIPLLDGTRTLRRVIEEAAPRVPPVEVGRLVGRLGRADLVGYRVPAADEAAAAYWELAGADAAAAARRLAGAPVAVETVGPVAAGRASAARLACRDSGLAALEPGEDGPAALALVLCDDYLDPELRETGRRHRAAGRPWLLAKPYDAEPWTGPVFRPDAGPCWSCLAHRLGERRSTELLVQRTLGLARPVARPAASLAAGRALGLQTAVLTAAKWLAGVDDPAADAVCVLDTVTLGLGLHRAQARPQCPDCGDPGLVAATVLAPVVPVPRAKSRDTGGGHRALSPAELLAAYGHLVDPVTGVVEEVRRDPRLPDGVNAYVSGRNRAVRADSPADAAGGLRTLSGGKGASPLEAEVSALGEAVERYSGTRHGDEPGVLDTLDGLGDLAIHPNDVQLFADRQFRDRHRWNPGRPSFHQVPAPFAADRPVRWTPVWSLSRGTHRWLPTSMLYFGTGPDAPAEGPWADSNGNAAGGTVEDAILQGFLELVERDAVGLWWYNRTRHPAVDLDAFDEPWITGLREVYARIRREVWVLDLTSDFGIPVMAALSRRTDKPAADIVFGFGAHLSPRLALRRALTEMGQLLSGVCDARPDGTGYAVTAPAPLRWWTTATVRNQPYLLPDPGQTPRGPGDYRLRPRDDLRDDIAVCAELAHARALEFLVLNQTRPDIGLPVVKVVIPGLRHFWPRFAPGRLFDVPVRLGLRGAPVPYDDLNPISLFV